MKGLLVPLIVLFALVAGCDRKTDNPKPKVAGATSAIYSGIHDADAQS